MELRWSVTTVRLLSHGEMTCNSRFEFQVKNKMYINRQQTREVSLYFPGDLSFETGASPSSSSVVAASRCYRSPPPPERGTSCVTFTTMTSVSLAYPPSVMGSLESSFFGDIHFQE